MKQIEREFISRRKQGKTEKAKEEKRDMKKNRRKKKQKQICKLYIYFSKTHQKNIYTFLN